MFTTFADKPIKGFCHAQVTSSSLHLPQCKYLSKHILTDGFKRVEVCDVHRDVLFRHNEIWKTQWRELPSAEKDQTEQKAQKKVGPYQVIPYNRSRGGHPVHCFYALDHSGPSKGSYRVAGFVCESEAHHFVNYCNRQLEKHNTTDMDQWDWT